MKNKKGFAQLQGLIMSIVLIAIVLAIGFVVLTQFQQVIGTTGAPNASAAYNATGAIITSLTTIPTWITILILVAIAGIVLSYLMGFFGGRQRAG